MPRRPTGRAALTAIAALALVPAAARGADAPVSFGNFAYSPAAVRIAPGDTVTWSGAFSMHPLEGQGPIGGPTSTGVATTVAFPAPGRYSYICTFHDLSHGMVGSVTVTANHPPTARFTATPATAGALVTFTSASSDPDPGQMLGYAWDLDGDGVYDPGATAPTATRTYTRAGPVTVRLRVTDSNGDPIGPESAETAVTIQVAPASAVAGVRRRATLGLLGTTLSRSGSRVAVRIRSAVAGRATVRLRRRGSTLAQGATRFAAPGTRTVRLRLTRRGRAALRAGRRTGATIVVTVRRPGGSATLSRPVRVRG